MKCLARNMRKHRLALGLFVLLFLLFASNLPLAPPRTEAAAKPRRTLGLFYTYYTDSTKEFGCGTYNTCTHVRQGCTTVYWDREPIICDE
jgi:hypothetical protein